MNIIFGAGVVGKVITRHLLDNNIAVNYICDNNIEKDGEEIFGVVILPFLTLAKNRISVV